MKFLGTTVFAYLALSLVSLWPVSASAALDLCQARQSALEFIIDQQTSRDGDIYKIGEWPSTVRFGGFARNLGLLSEDFLDDPNAFTTASVHNILAEIYLKYNRDKRLPLRINTALRALERYQTSNGAYNFWPRVAGAVRDLHLPRFKMTSSLVEGLLAIPADADDTAVVEFSRLANLQVCKAERGFNATGCVELNPQVEAHFTPYTDGWRLPAPSNLGRGEIGTGAYLTWLQHEPWVPFLFHAIGPVENGPRIVLDKNDVDCVVNANVLRTLSLYGKTDARGYDNACRLLLSNARDDDYNSCGDYYPDTYWYHYSVARAFSDGVVCLRPAMEIAMRHLLDNQLGDGRWKNELLPNDDILATGFALGALLKVGNQQDARQQAAIKRGIAYLLQVMRKDVNGHAYWPGGVFFSAGVPARRDVLWSSDSFTTAVITLALYDASAWLPTRKTCSL